MRILIDMDGVLADFEQGIIDTYQARHPNKDYIPKEQRTTFYTKDQYPKETQPLIQDICLSKGFFLGLSPIQGSLQALSELSARGDKIYICTSPLLENPFCIQEKYNWIIKHLGKEWTKKVIMTKDKTIINADLLIDDKPDITGIQTPTWEQLLYTQPYNAQINSLRRITWQDWKSIIDA